MKRNDDRITSSANRAQSSPSGSAAWGKPLRSQRSTNSSHLLDAGLAADAEERHLVAQVRLHRGDTCRLPVARRSPRGPEPHDEVLAGEGGEVDRATVDGRDDAAEGILVEGDRLGPRPTAPSAPPEHRQRGQDHESAAVTRSMHR